jgi:ribosome maturation factor RimP
MPPGTGAGRSAEARQKLLDMLTPVVAATGYELEDVSVTPAGRRSLVRVTVDADGGVDLDAVAEVSRAVSKSLDAEGAPNFAGPYVLEVSSPGVDRPLTEPRHWRRATGRLVRVPVGDVPTVGRVVRAGDTAIVLETDGVRREIPFAELGSGQVQVEFHRPGADDGRDTSEED